MLQAQSSFWTHAKNRALSPPPPSRQGRLFPPCRGIPVISLCVLRGSLLRRPVELRFVDPHAVQDNRKLARDGDLGLAEAVSLGELGSPCLQSRPFRYAGQQHAGCLEQIHAQHGVTALRDSAGPIDFPGSMASSRQSDIGPDTSRSLEARRIVDRRLEAECGDWADTRYGHKPADLHVMTCQLVNLTVEIIDLLLDGIARLKQRPHCSNQLGTIVDQLRGSHSKDVELVTGPTTTWLWTEPGALDLTNKAIASGSESTTPSCTID